MGTRRWRRKASVGRISILSGWSVAGFAVGMVAPVLGVAVCEPLRTCRLTIMGPFPLFSPQSLSLPHPLFHCSSFSSPSSLPSSFFVAHTLALSLYSPPARLRAAETRLGRGDTLGGGQPREWGSCLEAGSSSFSDMRDPRSHGDPQGSLKVELALSWVPTHPSALSGQTMALSSLLSMCPELCLCVPLPHLLRLNPNMVALGGGPLGGESVMRVVPL